MRDSEEAREVFRVNWCEAIQNGARVRFSSCPGLVKDSVRPRGDPPENVNGGARFASVDRPSHAGIDV